MFYSMDESLKDYVKRSLGARLDSESLEKITQILIDQGVLETEYLRDEIIDRKILINEGIPIAQVNRLYFTWTQNTAQPGPSTAPDRTVAQPFANSAQYVNIQIDYDATGLTEYLEQPKTLSSEHYRIFVHEVWQQIESRFGSQPGINVIRRICGGIANQYPYHFRDTCQGEQLNSYRKLADRIETHRLYKNPGRNKNKQSQKRRSETVGTRNFTADLPPGETKETQESAQRDLKELKQQDKSQWDLIMISEKMMLLYPTLRKDINEGKSVKVLEENWPFFFTYDIFVAHFKHLTEVDIEEKIKYLLEYKVDFYLQFFTQFSKKNKECATIQLEMQAACPNIVGDEKKLLALLKMITANFATDKFNTMFIVKEETTRDAALNGDCTYPVTPFIVGLGAHEWACSEYCVLIESNVVHRVNTLEQAFAMMFVAYWNINMQYPMNLNSTLDFIQRFVIGMNPGENGGTKCSKKGRPTASEYRIKVQNLMQEIEQFELTCKKIKDKFSPAP